MAANLGMPKFAELFHGVLHPSARPTFLLSVGMVGFCFAEGPIERWEDMDTINTPKFAALFHGLLQRGIYWWPKPTGVRFLAPCVSGFTCGFAAAASCLSILATAAAHIGWHLVCSCICIGAKSSGSLCC